MPVIQIEDDFEKLVCHRLSRKNSETTEMWKRVNFVIVTDVHYSSYRGNFVLTLLGSQLRECYKNYSIFCSRLIFAAVMSHHRISVSSILPVS